MPEALAPVLQSPLPVPEKPAERPEERYACSLVAVCLFLCWFVAVVVWSTLVLCARRALPDSCFY